MAEAKKQEAPGTALVAWQEELAKMAVATAEAEKPTGSFMSFKNGQLTIGGNKMKDNKAEIVVLHSIFENQMYAGKYDPNNQQPPICYALGETDDDLKPHPEAAEPQHTDCKTCPMNAWKSDPNGGKGKACKNTRRLVAMSAADLDSVESIQKADVVTAKIPVTSVKNWASYASQVSNVLHLPPLAVRTEISVRSDDDTILQVEFALVDKIANGDILQALLKKRGQTHEIAFSHYDKPTAAPAQPAGGKKY
jgi:hypothetical protein